MSSFQNQLLPVMEHLNTLQGEGFWAGNTAYFIRLGGCDVGCTWCDVKESWDVDLHPQYSVKTMVDWLDINKSQIVVITGGEPTMHNLSELTNAIQYKGIRTHIETSGTNQLTGSWNWITFSPKRFKEPLEEYYQIANELKIIIAHRNDLRWAMKFAERMNPNCYLYIQPEWDRRSQMESLCINFVKENPEWRLSLQTHKYLGIN